MKNWRRITALLLSLALVLTMCCVNIFAEDVTGNKTNSSTEAVEPDKTGDEGTADAASTDTEISEDIGYGVYAEAIHTLFRFGILNEETFNKTAEVTRGSFVAASIQLLGIGNIIKPCDTVFSDVKADNPNSGAIAAAYNMGIILGLSDNTFHPDEILTKDQAVKILVCILGYEVHAKSYGGYPSGYLTVASMQGILKKINDQDAKLTWDMGAQIIYNAMNADLLQKKSYPDLEYYTVKGENAMTKYMGIYLYEGTVTANSITSLTTGEGVKEGYVIIGNELFVENGTGAFDLLGYPIEAYYKINDAGTDKVLMSIGVKSSVSELTVNAKDIDGSSTNEELVYYAEGKINPNKVIFSSTPYVIFNGKLYSAQKGIAPAKIPYPKIGNVKLVDVNNDSKYDIIYIESVDIYVVDKTSESTGLIKDLYSMPDLTLDPTDADLEYTIEKYGEPIEFSKIKANNVLSVMKSQDGEYIKIIVCSEKIKGVLQEISDDTLNIDGTEYEMVKSNKSEFNKLKVGDRTTFYFTYDDLIAGFGDVTVSGEAYAYVYDGIYDKQDLNLGNTAQFRFFMTDGSVKTLTTSENFQYNGDKKDTNGNCFNGKYLVDDVLTIYNSTIGKNVFAHQLVKIVVNDKGLLTSMTTFKDNRVQANGTGRGCDDFSIDYSFHTAKTENIYNKDYYDTRGGYRYITYKNMGLLNSKYITSGAIAINIPNEEAFNNYYNGNLSLSDLEKQFSIFTISSQWENDGPIYNVDLYDVDDNRVIGVIVQFPFINSGANAAAASEEFFVVDKISNSIDSEGYPVKKLYGLYKGTEVGYVIDEDATAFTEYSYCKPFNLKKGDVIRIALNSINEITNILKVFTLDGTAPGADLYILNGNQFDDIEARSDPRSFGTDQGYPTVNPNSVSITSYKEKTFSQSGLPNIKSTWVSTHRAVHARYANVSGTIGEVTFGSRKDGTTPSNKLLQVGISTTMIYVYDQKSNMIRLGTVADIDPDNPNQTAVIRMRHSVGYETLLVNRAEDPGTLNWVGNYSD